MLFWDGIVGFGWMSSGVGRAFWITITALLFAALTTPAHANPGPYQDTLTPEIVLERASMSRVEFSNVIFELRSAIPDMDSKEKLGPFLKILENLKNIQIELNFAAFDSDMLVELSGRLTTHIEPQLDIQSDPDWLLIEFARWAEEGPRSRFCERQRTLIPRAKNPTEILKIQQNIIAIMNALKNPPPIGAGQPPSIDEFVKLQSANFRRLIDAHFDTTDPEIVRAMLSSTDKPAALEGLIESLTRKAYVTKNSSDLTKIMQILLEVRKRLQNMNFDTFPESALAAASSALSTTMLKTVEQGFAISPQIGVEALDELDPNHMDAVGAGIGSLQPTATKPAQFNLLTVLSERMAFHYGRYGMRAQEASMHALAAKYALGAKVHEEDLEGIYKIKIGSEEGFFSFARMDSADVATAIGYKHLSISMTHSWFDLENQHFQSSSVQDARQPSSGATSQPDAPTQTATYRFKINQSNDGLENSRLEVAGTLRIGVTEQLFTGHRISKFPDYIRIAERETLLENSQTPILKMVNPCGKYQGTVAGYPATLRVATDRMNLSANIVLAPDSTSVLIPFDHVHVMSKAGVIYMTARQQTAFLQLRGIVDDSGLKGVYIAGGRQAVVEANFIKSSSDPVCVNRSNS
jgi:hypothetical protein